MSQTTGRRPLPRLQQIGGNREHGTSHKNQNGKNCKDVENGMNVCLRSFCKILAHSSFFLFGSEFCFFDKHWVTNSEQSPASSNELSRSFAYRQQRFLCKRRVCEQNTSPRAFDTCHFRIFFSCTRDTSPTLTRSLKCEMYCVLFFLKVIPSRSCFITPCLTNSCPHSSLHFFGHRHPVLQLHPRCSFLRRVQPLPLRKEGCSLAAWPNKALSQSVRSLTVCSQLSLFGGGMERL